MHSFRRLQKFIEKGSDLKTFISFVEKIFGQLRPIYIKIVNFMTEEI